VQIRLTKARWGLILTAKARTVGRKGDRMSNRFVCDICLETIGGTESYCRVSLIEVVYNSPDNEERRSTRSIDICKECAGGDGAKQIARMMGM